MLIAIILLAFLSVTLLALQLVPAIGPTAAKGEGPIAALRPFLVPLAKMNAGLSIEGYRTTLRQLMISAGEPIELDPDEFVALQYVSFVVAFLVFWLVIGWSLIACLGLGVLGFFLPYFWLKEQVKARHQQVFRQLPDFLDLLTLSVEAGMDFGAALDRILGLFRDRGNVTALVEEFQVAHREMQLGATREEALRNLSERVGLEEVDSFVSALIQADRLGASLGPTLRIQADQSRIKRMQRADKLAGEAPVKLLVPLMLFILPAVFAVLLGPVALQIMRSGF